METAMRICAMALLCGIAATPAMAEGFHAAADAGQTTASCNGMAACNDSGAPTDAVYGFAPIAAIGLNRTAAGGWTGGRQRNADETPAADAAPRYGQILGGAESRFGLFRIQPKSSTTPDVSSGSDPVYGIGAQYDFSRDIALHAKYERLGAADDTDGAGKAKTSLFSVGAVYRF